MRITTITTGMLAALMLLPASAGAVQGQYGDYPMPTGSICLSGNCFQIGQGESVTESVAVNFTPSSPTYGFWHTSGGSYSPDSSGCWYVHKSMDLWRQAGSPVGSTTCVYVGSEIVARHFKRWLFNDIPEQDKDQIMPMQEAIYNETRVGGQLFWTQVSVSPVRAQTKDTFCGFYAASSHGDYPVGVALDRTPDSIMAACEFTRRVSDAQTGTGGASGGSQVSPIVVPASAARCGAVRPAGGLVAVRSSRHSCTVARSVVARYARSLRSPAGWACMAVVRDTGLRARCTRKVAGRATPRSAVYGIWVRR